MKEQSHAIGSEDGQGLGSKKTTRRDFINLLAATAGVPAAGAAVWTLIDQMNPDASVLAQGSKEVDLGGIERGQGVKVMWRGKPVFIRHRTEAETQTAVATSLSELKDRNARSALTNAAADAADANRCLNDAWIVVIGICTHLGCIPIGTATSEERGDYGGWYCPCHGSHYDTSGRIRLGPANQNLAVPPYTFIAEQTIRIG